MVMDEDRRRLDMRKRKVTLILVACIVLCVIGCGVVAAFDGDESKEQQSETEAESEPEVRGDAEAGFTDDVMIGSDVEIETETESQKESEIASEDPSIFERPEGVVKVGTDFLEEEDMSWATSKEETEEYMDVELNGEDSYVIDLFPWVYPYDYSCYIQDFQQTEDGTYQLVILPIIFISETETERLKAYGIEDFHESYMIIEDQTETVTLELTEDTSYYVINWDHSRELDKRSKNRSTESFVCELKDGALFYRYMRTTYGEGFARYPMFINLNEDGTVKEVIELCIP